MGLKCGQAKHKTHANVLQQCFVVLLFLIRGKTMVFFTDIDLLFLVSEAFFTEFVRISIPQGFVASIFSKCALRYWLI
jgi:hypothetical protein